VSQKPLLRGYFLLAKEISAGKICEKSDLKPMIWSDMYFTLKGNMRDYDLEAVIPEEVIQDKGMRISIKNTYDGYIISANPKECNEADITKD
jgi:hypothetical protein